MKRRVGILGNGYMGAIRQAVAGARADCEVARVFDGRDSGWRDVVDDPALDSVFVCLPSGLTCEAVCRALERKKDVFAEKPPGVSVAQVRQMIAAESASGKTLKFGFNHRYHPAVRAAERRIAIGDLGDLVWLRGRYGKPVTPGYDATWRAERALAGGGILMDQGIHMLDLMRAFSGGLAEPEALATASFSKGVEDDLVAVLWGEAGRVAVLRSSHTVTEPVFSLEMGFREGSVAIEGLLSKSGRYGPEQLRWRTHASPEPRVETFTVDDSWKLELDEFFECAGTGAPIRVGSTSEALELMILVEAIYTSAGWPLG